MILRIKVVVFIVASIGIAWINRSSLRDFRSHGFYRFFAWEAILALILSNIDYWFHEPFSAHQVFSWVLLMASLFLVVHGVQSLRRVGKPDSKRIDPSLIGIEKTTELVTVGAYRHIRHPLYSSLLFLTLGTFLKHLSWVSISLAVIATLFLTMTARREETENIRFFGSDYQTYMQETKMFIPYLF